MSDPCLEYLIPERVQTAEIEARLQDRWRLALSPGETLSQTFYDTFDWAVFAAGGTLAGRGNGQARRLIWAPLEGDDPPLSQNQGGEPGFVTDLPPGPVRERLLGVCGIRRLLRLVQIEIHVRHLRLINDDDKTVLRLSIETQRFQDPSSGRQGPLATRLTLLPVSGHEHALAQAAELLEGGLGLVGVSTPLLLEALAAAGRRPADYSSKLDYRLDPTERADTVAREILTGLLDTLVANLDGVRANLDSEFLHDLRVATRRTRSALAQIPEVFPDDLVEHYKARFAWVQQVTGPLRDLDVYLLDFDAYRQSLPPGLQPHLDPLRLYLLGLYEQEQRRLVAVLESQEFNQLIQDWRTFLGATLPEQPGAANALRPIKAVADARIWRMAKRVRREGRAIRPDSPPADLHELRKSCKKLRYLIEFFQSLYPARDIRRLIRLLKTLLDNLGSYQDLAVQVQHLTELAQRMREEERTPTETLLAIGALIGLLLQRQQQARDVFAEVFAAYLDEEHQGLLRVLFGSKPRSE